jgi:hypothetical protein
MFWAYSGWSDEAFVASSAGFLFYHCKNLQIILPVATGTK